MNNKTVLCCIVDNHPRFYWEYLVWVLCADKYVDRTKVDLKAYFINGCPADLVHFGDKHGVIAAVKDTFSHESPHCNKILPTLDEENYEYDHIIVTDTDLFIVDDVTVYCNEQDIRLAPNNHNNPPSELYQRIFNAIGFGNIRGGVALFTNQTGTRESYVNNNSGGILLLPKKHYSTFPEKWAKWANYLIANRALLARWAIHVDQVSLAIAMEEIGQDINFLPPQVNCVLELLPQLNNVMAFHLAKTHRERFDAWFNEDNTLKSNVFSPFIARSIKRLNEEIREANDLSVKLPSLIQYIKNRKGTERELVFKGGDFSFKKTVVAATSAKKDNTEAASELRQLKAAILPLNKTIEAIEFSGLFDKEWYLTTYPDVKKSGNNPIAHYVKSGAKEGRNPSSKFDTFGYRGQNKVVGRSGMNPLFHYYKFGVEQGLNPTPNKIDHYQSFEGLIEEQNIEGENTQLDISGKETKVRPIAFYLPQFHEIEENNKWWGKGFTEWTHVQSCFPTFVGHNQPRVPSDDLGYYNLLNPEVLHKQAEMARNAGIEGFSFYYYSFLDTRLLDKPLDLLYENKDIDIKYNIFWANHPWTRRWYGQERVVLKDIEYGKAFYLKFIQEMDKYLRDERYIRINGKPVIMMLHVRPPDGPPDFEQARIMTDIWREYCLKEGIGEIHLMFSQLDYSQSMNRLIYGLGFDAAFEFLPAVEMNTLTDISSRMPMPTNFKGSVFSYDAMMKKREEFHNGVEHDLYPCVTPRWDNSARYANKATLFFGSTPDKFGKWIDENQKYLLKNFKTKEERLLFINGWNEWSEGAHLEPDQRFGYAYLNAVAKSLSRF